MGLYGQWKSAGVTLRNLSQNISRDADKQLREDAEYVKDKIVGHIDSQDLPWASLSPITVRIKKSAKIYVDTGTLRDSITVRGIKSGVRRSTVFIGANSYTVHSPSGMRMSQLMNILEYGTRYAPPRPLIRPTWEEVRPEIENRWTKGFVERLKNGVVR